MQRARKPYASDLCDRQWNLIKFWIPEARAGGRPRTTSMRSVVNAIFYLARSGCAWRYLPRDFPPWQTVYDYFSKWVKAGIWIKIH
jgi:putative transposase